jgi:hypothetical protein
VLTKFKIGSTFKILTRPLQQTDGKLCEQSSMFWSSREVILRPSVPFVASCEEISKFVSRRHNPPAGGIVAIERIK